MMEECGISSASWSVVISIGLLQTIVLLLPSRLDQVLGLRGKLMQGEITPQINEGRNRSKNKPPYPGKEKRAAWGT